MSEIKQSTVKSKKDKRIVSKEICSLKSMNEVAKNMNNEQELGENYRRKQRENCVKKLNKAIKEKLTSENFTEIMRESYKKHSCHHEDDAIFLSLVCEKFALYKNYRDQREKKILNFSTIAILKESIKMVENHFGIAPISDVQEKWRYILTLDDPMTAKLIEFIDENNIENFPKFMKKVTKSLETYMRDYILYENIKLPRKSEQLPNISKKTELLSMLNMLIGVVKLDDKDETHIEEVFSTSEDVKNTKKTVASKACKRNLFDNDFELLSKKNKRKK